MTPHRSPNPWPLGIIVCFAVFFGGVVTFTVFAMRQKMDLVRPDYYEEEIRYQRQIDRLTHGQAVRHQVAVRYDVGQQAVCVTLPALHRVSALHGQIQLYRPSDASLDRSIPLATDSNGVQRIDARPLRAGLWKVRVAWQVNDEEFFHDQSVVVGGPSI